ncbi:galectin-related protein A [Anguilla anguilla]|uniref:galectin-related protein A n=1 Tax=Anguilla anguilla TaxID=7936 RepID=UPI0015AE48B3|nr:galectin-related protein A [Anguilla anguilla]
MQRLGRSLCLPSPLVYNDDKGFFLYDCHCHRCTETLSRRFTPAVTADQRKMAEIDKIKNEEMYIGEIKGGLRPSMRLVVMGIVKQQPKSMVVAVVCHPEDDADSDVGLQVTVSFQDRAVLRNARLGGKWGASENALSYFPFAAGEPFKMEIVCEHQQFRILVDGQPLCGFTHRVTQLASLTALHIYGDLQLTKVA